jgi:Tfp pilus assembly protein PilF
VDALLDAPARAELPSPPAPPARAAEPPRTHRVALSATPQRTQVLDARIAQRRDHDPARASTLLDTYFEGNRHGPLREEALVLAIEAADGRGDAARAVRFARTYQNEFPHGRFDAYVRSHLQD